MMTAVNPCIVSRTFAAPRDVLWRAWTEHESLAKWFGPKGTTTPMVRMKLRAGESSHYSMAMPDGKEMWGKFIYREIIPLEKIAWVNSFSDRHGGISRHPFSATWPLQMLTEVTFAGRDGHTIVTIKWLPLEASDEEWETFDSAHNSMGDRWSGTFDRLAEYLANN
jgi:uncharacterized protein YndB with AHSA1/START domain